MNNSQKQLFIENDLYYELRCLLGSTTLWQIYREKEKGFEVVVAMDSALLHARTLFEFFCPTGKGKNNTNNIKATEFGIDKSYKSQLYSTNKEALNRHVFHLNEKRLKPTNKKNSGHINEKIFDFTDEVIRLWKCLEDDSQIEELRVTLKTARSWAIRDASNDAQSHLRKPLFSVEVPE